MKKKVMTNLDSILKSRDITLPTKVHLVKAMVFPAVVYGRESGTMKKAESQRMVFKSINYLKLSFLHSPTFTYIHDHWKNHSLE